MDIFKELKVKLIEELDEYLNTQTKGKFITQLLDAGYDIELISTIVKSSKECLFESACYRAFELTKKPSIDILIDGKEVLSNQTNIGGAFQKLIINYLGGAKFLLKMDNERWNPHIIPTKDKNEYAKKFTSSIGWIDDPNSKYSIVKQRVLASTATKEMVKKYGDNAVAQNMTAIGLINGYLGYEKITVKCSFTPYSKILNLYLNK